jgi:hypothetical protein
VEPPAGIFRNERTIRDDSGSIFYIILIIGFLKTPFTYPLRRR